MSKLMRNLLFIILTFSIILFCFFYFELHKYSAEMEATINNQKETIETLNKNIEKLQVLLLEITTIANDNAALANKASKGAKKATTVKIKNIEEIKDNLNEDSNTSVGLSIELDRLWNEYEISKH